MGNTYKSARHPMQYILFQPAVKHLPHCTLKAAVQEARIALRHAVMPLTAHTPTCYDTVLAESLMQPLCQHTYTCDVATNNLQATTRSNHTHCAAQVVCTQQNELLSGKAGRQHKGMYACMYVLSCAPSRIKHDRIRTQSRTTSSQGFS